MSDENVLLYAPSLFTKPKDLLLIYDNGNQYEKITGGFKSLIYSSSYANSGAVIEDTALAFRSPSKKCHGGIFVTNNKIDLTEYNALLCEYSLTKYDSPWTNDNGRLKFGCGAQSGADGITTTGELTGLASYARSITSYRGGAIQNLKWVDILNLSTITGEGSIYVGYNPSYPTYSRDEYIDCAFHRIWLAK